MNKIVIKEPSRHIYKIEIGSVWLNRGVPGTGRCEFRLQASDGSHFVGSNKSYMSKAGARQAARRLADKLHLRLEVGK